MWHSWQKRVGAVTVAALVGGLLVAGPAQAFAPHRWFSGPDDSHQSITERVFRDLAAEFFGVSPPTKGMRAALKEWTKANAAVDDDQKHSALHFDGENFQEGQQRLIDLSASAVSQLAADDVTSARRSVGGALHTVQDFYSHTNWVELGNVGANPDLGREGRTLGPVAGPTEPTCDGSELITTKLTSGYYSGEDKQPLIEGKCRHGGQFDKDSEDGSGINKDFHEYPQLSPHFEFHGAAVQAAVAGTDQYIRDIKAKVTDEQLRRLFGLGPALAVVMDISGSMDGIREPLNDQVDAMIDARVGTDQEPSEYVLVGFTDPEVSAPLRTHDPDVFKASLHALQTDSSPECPARSMTGLSYALDATAEGGEVFLFTDADAKDPELRSENVLRAQSKNIRISPMIFGRCPAATAAIAATGGKSRKAVAGDRPHSRDKGTRAGAGAAAVAADDTYRRVADGSGGQMLELGYADAGKAAKLAELTARQGPATVLRSTITLTDQPTVVTVPVDSTTRKATFAVTGPTGASQRTTVTRPDGSVVQPGDAGVEPVPLDAASGPATLLAVDRPAVGEWKLTIEGTGTASVLVTADSILDLSTFEFVSSGYLDPEPSAEVPGPVSQTPPPGPVTVHAAVSADVRSATFEFRTADGAVQDTFTLPRQGTEFAGGTTLPNGAPVIYLRGQDSTGAAFQRTLSTAIRQQNPNLEVTPDPPAPLAPGVVTTRSVTVRNLGPAGSFTIRQDSDRAFGAHRQNVTLGTGASVSVRTEFTVPESAAGDTVTLSMFVTDQGRLDSVAMLEQVVPIAPLPAPVFVSATPDGPSVRVTTTQARQNAAVQFPGHAGQRVSFQLSDVSLPYPYAMTVSLRSPNGGGPLVSRDDCRQSCFIEPVTLPTDGAYTLVIDPFGVAVGSISVRVFDAPVIPVVATTLDGAKQTLTTAAPGQNAGLSFSARAGRRVSVVASGSTYLQSVAVYFQLPNGDTLAPRGGLDGSGGGGYFDPTELPADGSYTLWVDPAFTATGSVTLQVYDVPADLSLRVDPGAGPVRVQAAAPGQNATLTIAGSAGQRLSLNLTDADYAAAGYSVFSPSGDLLTGVVGCNSGCLSELPVLTATGDYRVVLRGSRLALRMTAQTFDVSVDATAAVVVGGAAATVTISSPGQNAVISFAGTAGRKVTVVASAQSPAWIREASLRDPAGALVGPTLLCNQECALPAVVLPATGTYQLALDSAYASTGPITIRAYDVSSDLSVPATAGGAAVTVTTTVPGQNTVVPFAAAAGQRLSVALSAGSHTGPVTATLLRPDGTTVATNSACASACFFDVTSTAAAGTYRLQVDPQDAATGAVSVRVYVVPADAAATATIGAAGPTVSTTVPGQNAVVSFAGTANRVVTVAVSRATFTGTTTYTVRKPDGSTLSTKTATGASTSFANLTLPVAGTYSVLINPSGTVIGSARVTLTSTTVTKAAVRSTVCARCAQL